MNVRFLIERAQIAAATLLVLSLTVGCSDDDSNPTSAPEDVEEISLESEYGGYQAEDEVPAFGDPDLADSVEEEVEFDDPATDDPSVREMEENPRTRSYALTLTWGFLDQVDMDDIGGDGGGNTVDWTGYLEINHGAIIVQRILSFERGQDALLPRSDPGRLDWVSANSRGFDGVRVLIHQPPTDGSEEVTLSLHTSSYSAQFPIADLEQLDRVVTVDGRGNQVSIQAFEALPTASTQGFAMGKWGTETRDGSGFSGRWLDVNGQVVGFVHGIYGKNGAGQNVLFGKYIDRVGDFRGLIRGTWSESQEPGGLNGSNGHFRAEILAQDGDDRPHAIGVLDGRWRKRGNAEGVFEARWCVECP